MADHLKRARSMKVADAPLRVEHHFDCPPCRRVTRTTTGWPPLGQDHSGLKLAPQFECRQAPNR